MEDLEDLGAMRLTPEERAARTARGEGGGGESDSEDDIGGAAVAAGSGGRTTVGRKKIIGALRALYFLTA